MRARRVASSYRAILEDVAPDECHKLDARMIEMGINWIAPQIASYTDDSWLSAEEVADYFGVSLATVYSWRRRGLPSVITNEGVRFQFSEVRRWIAGCRGDG